MADDNFVFSDSLPAEFSFNGIESDALWALPPSSLVAENIHFPFGALDSFTSETEGFSGRANGRKSRKRRGKVYTGCLTCRTRKIKCDGSKPFCLNCQRSRHYICHGYVDPSGSITRDDHSTDHRPSKRPNIGSSGRLSECTEHDNDEEPDQHTSSGPHDRTILRTGVNGRISALNDITETNSIHLPTEVCDDLFAHYRNVVCHLLMPTIDSFRNPYLQIILPMALKESPSATHRALRYSLLAVSAIHISRISPSPENQSRAQWLQETSQRLIMAVLNEQPDGLETLDKCALLGGATILISADVISGESRDSTSSINLAKQVFHKTGGEAFWKHNARPSILYQLLRCHDLIASTANLHCPPKSAEFATSSILGAVDIDSALSSNRPRQDSILPIEHYILDTSFGISMHTISLLGQILHLSAICSSLPWTSATRAAVRDVQQRLHSFEEGQNGNGNGAQLVQTSSSSTVYFELAAPSSPSLPSLPPAVRDELLENHLWAFHYAVILFFYRIVYPNLDTMLDDAVATSALSSRLDGQRYVEDIIERLENMDCLTQGDETCPANTLWPALVAGCEACGTSLRQRVLIWLTRAARKGLGNIASAKKLILEVWRRVDRYAPEGGFDHGLSSIDWRTVMRDMELSFNLC